MDRAREVLRRNEKYSSAGRRLWELSGGILRCVECGRALVALTVSKKRPEGKRGHVFYYRCSTRRQRGKHACSFSRSVNAEKAEAAVWGAVSSLLTDPDSLKRDLEAMIERERKTFGDPEPGAKAAAATLSEVERKRDRYQEMFAADAMTIDELRAKLDALEETRETAQRELAALASWRESLQTLERDKDRLLDSYATLAPEALASLDAGERRTVYSMLGIRVEALQDKTLRV
ncbi:MAG: recombinase zinc beta ribbon domain-containing protein, partial [Actinomycetota bacterium]|nr:recombinase zinc beta ribbon domain-containing protein [Actinomycetota bacterium]